MTNHSSDDLIRAVREGDVEKASALITTFGLSYSEAWSDGYTLLCNALSKKRTEIAKILLEHDAAVNSKKKSQTNTPLHFAIRNKKSEIVSMLLDRKANVDARNYFGETPLHLSIKKNNLKMVSLLLDKNADVNAVIKWNEIPAKMNWEIYIANQKSGYTPLHYACAYRREEIVKLLLKRGANINARTKKQFTALHLAAADKCDKIVEVLLKHDSVDIDAEDDRGKTVLNIAIEQDDLPTITKILEICPQVINNDKYRHCIRDCLYRPDNKQCSSTTVVKTLLSHGICVHPEDAIDRKLLHAAIERGYTEIVEDLLRYDADVDSPYVPNGHTLLHTAAINKQLDIAEILIKHGADVNAIDETGQTALWHVLSFMFLLNCLPETRLMKPNRKKRSRKKRSRKKPSQNKPSQAKTSQNKEDEYRDWLDLAKLLLSRGVEVNAKDEDGSSFLHIAVENGSDDMVEILLRYNADVNIVTDNSMETPLHYAAVEGNEQILRTLLNAGAVINATDEKGETALHRACQRNNGKIVEILLEFGAEIEHKNSENWTPLHIAANYGSLEAVETLLESFANVECMDKNGKTALHLALNRRSPKIVEKLLDYGADVNVTCKKCHSPIDYTALGLYRSNENQAEGDFHFEHHECVYDIDDYPLRFDDDWRYRMEIVKPSETIKRHIIKIKSLNIHNSKRHHASVELNDEFKDFQAKCEAEVGLKKSERIGETYISYHDIFMKSVNRLAMLLRNKHIVEVLKSCRYREKFPIYYKMLHYKIKKGQKRENLLNPSLRSFNFVSGFSLPELVSLKLLDKLSNKELEILIKAGPETESM